ncbi:MAG: hypothetical protein V1928_03245 [Parcubacteria group bacterium]
MEKSILVKIFKWLFIALAALLIIFLFWKNYSPTGEQTIDYNFTKNNFTAGLNPSARVQKIVCDKTGCGQAVFNDPTYLDMIMPRRFQTADVKLTLDNPNDFDVYFGVKTGPGWQYALSKVDQNGNAHLDLSVAYINKRTAEFILSIPSLKDNKYSVTVKGIKFTFKKDNFLKKILNKL